MINSLLLSLLRVTGFWYVVGILVLFIGPPSWAESIYSKLLRFPGVPELSMHGLGTAATVQLNLVVYWTIPILIMAVISLLCGWLVTEVSGRIELLQKRKRLTPSGLFWGVKVASYSLGHLPTAITPGRTAPAVTFNGTDKNKVLIAVKGPIAEALKLLTPDERSLCEEIIQLLYSYPDHYAGAGHGVGLLAHTFNVAAEAALKCTTEFRLPLLAALAHDIGKLATFKPDNKGGWIREGLHSRESARILVTLPSFQLLPEIHQRGLLLAVKYDHAPNKMPQLRGDREASALAMRIISSLSQADKKATAEEKDRHLAKIKPEDLLWNDFVDYLRDAPVVQMGRKGAANQVNNPPDSPYLFLYEAPWRDAAIRRMPPEVAAALDLSRRDAGKVAKYTRILTDILRKEGLLVESHEALSVSPQNPLWDIQSGNGEKAVVLRGILVIHAEALWKKLNYRIGIKSPFPVKILAPNADAKGQVNRAPEADKDIGPIPDISDGLKVADVADKDTLSSIGLSADPLTAPTKLKSRPRAAFRDPIEKDDSLSGMTPSSAPAKVSEEGKPLPVPKSPPEESKVNPDQGATAEVSSVDTALAFFTNPPVKAESADETPPDETPVKDVPEIETSVAAKETAPASSHPLDEGPGLSRSEKREGLSVADAAAVEAYPGLSLGDKYYTSQSREVLEGRKKVGSPYKGDTREKPIIATDAAPRRRARRVIK